MEAPQEPKRLYRSASNKMIAGVCGGIADYFNADATLVRLTAVLLAIFTGGAAVVAYLVMAIITPVQPDKATPSKPSV